MGRRHERASSKSLFYSIILTENWSTIPLLLLISKKIVKKFLRAEHLLRLHRTVQLSLQLAHRNNIRESLHSPFERPHPKDRGMKKRGVVGRINSKHDERERERVFSGGSRDWVTGCVPTPLRSFFRGGTSPLFNKSNTSIDPPQSS